MVKLRFPSVLSDDVASGLYSHATLAVVVFDPLTGSFSVNPVSAGLTCVTASFSVFSPSVSWIVMFPERVLSSLPDIVTSLAWNVASVSTW